LVRVDQCKERVLLVAAHVVDRNDAGMIELGDGARFGQIRFGFFRTGDETAMGDLDRDGPLQLVVVGQVNEAESALTENFLDAVATDVRGCGRSTNGRAGSPSRFVYGLVRIVHAGDPSFNWVW
jgi:hypothetical protein